MFHFLKLLIQHEIERDRFQTYHRQTWLRRNNLDPDGEDI